MAEQLHTRGVAPTGAISAASLLAVWERGHGEDPLRRALTILDLDFDRRRDAEPRPELLTMGERNRRLLDVRERLVGAPFDAVSRCPSCGEQLELSFTADDLRATDAPGEADATGAAAASASPAATTHAIDHHGYRVSFRLPSTADVLAAVESDAPPAHTLLRRCATVMTAGGGRDPRGTGDAGAAIDVANLPGELVAAIEERMAELDPMGNLEIRIPCTVCGHAWSAVLDIGRYLWDEIADRARRLVRDIHTLARAYGWRESDVLALSSWRRQLYLALVNGE